MVSNGLVEKLLLNISCCTCGTSWLYCNMDGFMSMCGTSWLYCYMDGFMSTSMRLGHILFMRQILFRFVRCGYVNIWVWNDLAWKMGYHGMHAWQGPWIDSSNHVISKNPTWWTFWASTVCYHGHYIGREDKKKMFSWTLRWVRGEDGGKSSAFECGWWEWGIRGFKSSDVINNF